MEIENKLFNGIEYTLVDTYEMGTEIVYHFVNEEDDIFCYKKEDKYIQIKDEKKINDIKEEFGLILPDILFARDFIDKVLDKIDGKEVFGRLDDEKSIKDAALEKLNELPEKDEINFELIQKRLETVEFFVGEWKSKIKGFYRPDSNYITYKKDAIKDKSISSERIKLHEIIHAAGGSTFASKTPRYMKGLIEGATENIVDRLFSQQRAVLLGRKDL